MSETLHTASELGAFKGQIRDLTRLVEQAETVISLQDHDEEDAGSDCSNDTSQGSLVEGREPEEMVQELKTQMRYLIQLGPTLQQNVINAKKARVQELYPPVVPFYLSGPAGAYVRLVRQKYPNAADQLINRLGEANWQRHQLIRKQIEAVARRGPELDGFGVDDTPFYNNNDDLYSAFRPYSAFHDSGIGTSVPEVSEYSPSHTSFLSSKDEDKAMRVPATPDELFAEEPFQCPLCGHKLRNVKSRVQWK